MPNQITCITKPDRQSSHEHITRVGGLNLEKQVFNISREECIAYIKRGFSFHVKADGYEVPVLVESRNGVEYIKTKPDRTTKDNLLNLPPCG